MTRGTIILFFFLHFPHLCICACVCVRVCRGEEEEPLKEYACCASVAKATVSGWLKRQSSILAFLLPADIKTKLQLINK